LSPYWSGGAALGAFALDEAVRQEHLLDRIVGLLDGAFGDVALVAVALVDQGREVAVLVGVGRVVVVEADAEGVEVRLVLLATRAISASGVMPSARALSMIGVPWASSAQTYQQLCPRIF
jgi:hypothetical protein